MTYVKPSIREFLADLSPFQQLPAAVLDDVANRFQLLRYRMGQSILRHETLPYQIAILMEGQARLLGYRPGSNQFPFTLKILQPGDVLGWIGLMRGIPCETAIASSEVVCATLPAHDFLELLKNYPQMADVFRQQPAIAEVSDILNDLYQSRAETGYDLKQIVADCYNQAKVQYLQPGTANLDALDPNYTWFISGGGIVANHTVKSQIRLEQRVVDVQSKMPTRLIGFPKALLEAPPAQNSAIAELAEDGTNQVPIDIPYAPERPPEPDDEDLIRDQITAPIRTPGRINYPHVRGRGILNATLACFQMLAQHLEMPFRRDILRRVLVEQQNRTGGLSLQLCGAVAEMMGLRAQLVKMPANAINRIEPPALIQWNDTFAVVYETSQKEVVLGVPESGVIRRTPAEFASVWGQEGEVLLLQRTNRTQQQKFGLSWFWPSLMRYRKVLIAVFVASFFVQLFGLANPLMIQVIIDKVIVQNSPDTLHVLGFFLVIVAIFEAILYSLRSYLFVDTTNRIDMALGSEIIDHLVRLPLRYFERRPVGELSSRVNELENIRQFLTGTALTVVLDAVFSVIYIVVMLFYSWQLTIVALLTIPLFVGLTLVVAPIVRRQLRVKAERNARTQSHLVEVLSGIQTVKAQSIELKSRWKWQELYSSYVSAGFKTVLTSTTAGSANNFLNKLSALLVLWAGAYLVLEGELTLGQLIAFRIISGYVTGPLLRLAGIWQNFQETALSLERLSDIIDTPQESDEDDRNKIPMPIIKGAVTYENLSFRFGTTGPMQLLNINLEFPPGQFIGIVGQSGSGKSTLMKLLPRLYEPQAGRILIDQYDIEKVELYSLRRQIGIVPQDSLLFEGTVQENISLTNPDASTDEIIQAAKIACAHDFIMDLPSGYNSQVGERGSNLSGGQRQRIAIARTILQNPRLLIMDEATSALDYDTERQVCQNLAEAFRDRTVFFITHRLSTIRGSDLILMMDKGAVVEQGTHDELMALQGRYYCLYQQQDAQL